MTKSLLALTLLGATLVCSCTAPLLATRADQAEPTTPFTRVFSRWTVKDNREDDFVSAWGTTTRQTLNAAKEFRGAFLLRSQKERTQFLSIELWTNTQSWQAFQTNSPAAIQSLVSSKSTEPFDEIFDRLETSEWKRHLIRIYGLRVDEKNRSAFIDTWLKVNLSIGAKIKGARGGLLLNDSGDRSMFYEVVRWDSSDTWQRFIAAPPADPEAFQKIFSLMSVISAESFDEIDFVERP